MSGLLDFSQAVSRYFASDYFISDIAFTIYRSWNISLSLLIPIVTIVTADYLRGEGRAVIFLIVLGSKENISCSHVYDGHVEEYDQDIAQIGKCPQVAKVQTGNVTQDTEGCHKEANDADGIDKLLVFADAVRCDFGEADHSDQAGVSEKAEADGDQEGDHCIGRGAGS